MPPIRAALPPLTLLLATLAPPPAAAPDEPLTGRLHVVWADAPQAEPAPDPVVFLVRDDGRAYRLRAADHALRAAGGALRLNGRRVEVSGDAVTGDAGRAAVLNVSSIRALSATAADGALPAAGADASALPEARPYVVLLCRFSDSPGEEPRPAADYERWMGGSEPGLDHYWRELSGDRVSLAGSVVVGPFVLPEPRATYLPGGDLDFARSANDCTAAADATVDFSRFRGIAMQFNQDLDGASWGGSWTLTLDGAVRTVGMMWMARWATQHTYAHEVGHTFGLPHSSGPYTRTYDSRWDVMSGGGGYDAAARTVVAVHTIAWHKALLGWIEPSRLHAVSGATADTVLLARSAITGASGVRMARIAVPGTAVFYTAESRRYAGYDADGRLPAEAVVLHRVDPLAAESSARVVDADGDGDPNDDGARWLPGETFRDTVAGVTLRVLREAADGFEVEIVTGGRLSVTSANARPRATMGAAYRDALSATGGAGERRWALDGGRLPDGLALDAAGVVSGVPAEYGDFSFVARVATATAFGTKSLDLRVDRPRLGREAVADHLLLGSSSLTADELRFLDLLGNADGALDLGDVQAWFADLEVNP